MYRSIQHSRILIVDDQEANVHLLEALLLQAGYDNVQCLTDSREVLPCCLAALPDLLLLDLMMPHLDGFAIMEELSARIDKAEYLPILVLTADTTVEVKHRALDAGARDFLAKPFDRTEVLLRVKNLLQTRLLHTHSQGQNRQLEGRLRAQAKDLAEVQTRSTRIEEDFRRQTSVDQLTGLANRSALHDELNKAIGVAETERTALALLVLDIDGFREINAALGYDGGDLLLREVAARLSRSVRHLDTVARLGADQFAVLLPGVGPAGANWAARKVLGAFAAPFSLQGHDLQVSASTGATLYPEHGADALALLRHAEIALQAAKHQEKPFALYTPEEDAHSIGRLVLLSELRQAIEQNQLVLNFQPKVHTGTKGTIGVEALVRWQHPRGELVPPDQFISLAEQSGTITALTHWVVEAAIQQCRRWHDIGLRLSVAVNVSMRCVHDSQLPQTISGLLRRYDAAPEWLTLEITESALMTDPERVQRVLSQLAAIGVKLSIDDFGTGYSVLSHLSRFPLHELKIDKSFIQNAVTNPRGATIVRSVVDLAHNLSLHVVAEGVENLRMWQMLNQWRCDAAQGYYLSRPLAADDLKRWLLTSPYGISNVADSAS